MLPARASDACDKAALERVTSEQIRVTVPESIKTTKRKFSVAPTGECAVRNGRARERVDRFRGSQAAARPALPAEPLGALALDANETNAYAGEAESATQPRPPAVAPVPGRTRPSCSAGPGSELDDHGRRFRCRATRCSSRDELVDARSVPGALSLMWRAWRPRLPRRGGPWRRGRGGRARGPP
jgi:hypothetical protein